MTTSAPSHLSLTFRRLDDSQPPQEVLLDEEGGTIGRAPANTAALTGDSNVSLVHATLEQIGTRWILKDIGDLVPVMKNGHPLGFGQKCEVSDGDSFSIASFELRVSFRPAHTTPSGHAEFLPTGAEAVPSMQSRELAGNTAPVVSHPDTLLAAQWQEAALTPTPASRPIPADELQRIQADPFSRPMQSENARNFLGNEDRLLDGALPDIERTEATALHNPLHRQANLDPLRHKAESIDSLFELEAGKGVDPLADIFGSDSVLPPHSTPAGSDAIMAVLEQQLGGTPIQQGSSRDAGLDLGTAIRTGSSRQGRD